MAFCLYNTLTRRKEPFVPREPGRVSMYTCGPTVYDYTHVGHLRPALVADVLKRHLTSQGNVVFHVTNFTDVDDRIIERARRDGVTPAALAGRYIEDYLENMRALGVDGVDLYVRVTAHIADVVAMIVRLVDKGFAYQVDGDVYFSVTAKADYGKLSGRALDELQAGARVEVDPRKHHPMDFALWKSAKPGEPYWPSPWGPGRPGWHIECSALSLRYLGEGFDIHGGGDDLIFPHHENEIAQSEAYADGHAFARYWLHNGMIQFEQEKMSKSLGNFVALRDLVARYPAGAIRLLLLTTHYRKPLNYSEAGLREAVRGWQRLETARVNLRSQSQSLGALATAAATRDGVGVADSGADPQRRSAAQALAELESSLNGFKEAFVSALDDDLNTAAAIGVLFDLVRVANGVQNHPDVPAEAAPVADAAAALDSMGSILGFWGAPNRAAAGDLTDGLVRLCLELRARARRDRDWATADLIRDQLSRLGIAVEDTPRGTRWKLAGS